MNTPIPIGTVASRLLLQTITDRTPLTRQARTAGPDDIKHIEQQFVLLTDLYMSAVTELMKKLNENLPVTETINMHDFNSCMADAKSELSGLLCQAMERDQ